MKIILDSITTIPAGVALKLNPRQIDARVHALEPWGDEADVYVGTQALVFKVGEEIEIVGDLPTGILPVYDKNRAVDDTPTNDRTEPVKHRRAAVAKPVPAAE